MSPYYGAQEGRVDYEWSEQCEVYVMMLHVSVYSFRFLVDVVTELTGGSIK